MSKEAEEAMHRLGELYSKTGKDWVITMHHILTEPVCPTVNIHPEDYPINKYAVHANTVDEAIIASCELAYKDVILGESVVRDWQDTSEERTWDEIQNDMDELDRKQAAFEDQCTDMIKQIIESAIDDSNADPDVPRNKLNGPHTPDFWASYLYARLRDEIMDNLIERNRHK